MLTTLAFVGLQGGGLYISSVLGGVLGEVLASLTHSIVHSNDVTLPANSAKLALP